MFGFNINVVFYYYYYFPTCTIHVKDVSSINWMCHFFIHLLIFHPFKLVDEHDTDQTWVLIFLNNSRTHSTL